MYASCEIVEYASTFLMSSCTSARNAARSSVIAPAIATTCNAIGSALTNTWNVRATRKIPNMNGTSPTRVVRNALIAAPELAGSSYQCPISRYEQTPMTSQPTRSWNRLPATTTSSMAPVKSESTTKNQV